MSDRTEKHPNPLVENIAQTLWNAEPHKMLEHAGYPTAWEDQPRIIKRSKWRLAIKSLGELSKNSCGLEDYGYISAEKAKADKLALLKKLKSDIAEVDKTGYIYIDGEPVYKMLIDRAIKEIEAE